MVQLGDQCPAYRKAAAVIPDSEMLRAIAATASANGSLIRSKRTHAIPVQTRDNHKTSGPRTTGSIRRSEVICTASVDATMIRGQYSALS
jgi:hypothetical protein